MNRLARHGAPVRNEQQHRGVHLECRAGERDTARDGIVDPAGPGPPGHQQVDGEGGGDGRALEVPSLAARVLGDRGHRHIEPRQPREAAEDKEGEAYVVHGRPDADREGYDCGGDAE